jgi:toxin HigB-1
LIRSFADRETERCWHGSASRKWSSDFARRALLKLRLIDSAEGLDDLRNPPGNRLEMLKGKRSGQYSIRINDQWRVCFRWREGGAYDVEIVDYH